MATNLETMFVVLDANVERMRREVKKASKSISSFERDTKKNLDKIDRNFMSLGQGAKSLAGFFGVTLGVNAVKDTLFLADSVDILQDRVKDATRETGNFEEVWDSLRETALDTGSAIEGNVALYQRLAQRTDALGASNGQILELVDSISKLGIIGGSSVSEMANGTLQLAQGLGEGIFRAQEFNSVLENMPAVMDAVARSMGVTVSDLRKMVVEGKLLSKDVFDAILNQSGDIEKRFSAIPPRLTRSWSSFLTAIEQRLSGINSELGVTTFFARWFDDMAVAITPLEELTESQVKQEIHEINNRLLELGAAMSEVGERTLDPLLGLVPGRLERDIRGYEERIQGLRKQREELEKLLNKNAPADTPTAPQAPPPITENYDIEPLVIDPKPIRESEEALHAYNMSIKELEIDVMRSQGNIAESIRASAQLQIDEWRKVAEETPEFAKQAAQAIELIVQKTEAEIANLGNKVSQDAKRFGDAMASAFESRGIDALLNGDISGALKGLASDFAEITLRLLVLKPLAESLFGALAGGGRLFGGLTSLFGFANGGTTSVPALVNERGTESLSSGKGLFVPIGGPATVVNAADTRRNMGGGQVVTQNFNIQTGLPDQIYTVVRNIAAQSGAEAAARMVRQSQGVI